MPVPSTMKDLSTLAASNSPAGSDAIGNSLDDYLRAISAIIRSTNANSSASIAAAPTVDLGTSDGEAVIVTGSATITSFGTVVSGLTREVVFSSAGSIITNSSAIVLPNSVNITVKAGDCITLRSLGSGNWRMVGSVRPIVVMADVTGLAAALATYQPLIGYTPVNKAGDTMTGGLTATSFSSSASGTYTGIASGIILQSSANGGTVFLQPNLGTTNQATLDQNGLFTAPSITSSGAMKALGGFGAYAGTVGAQALISAHGWGNGIARWQDVLETTAALSWYSYNSAGTFIGLQMTLTQAGALTLTTSVSAPTISDTSDVRLKANVAKREPREYLADAIDFVSFDWKKDGKSDIGVIAQQIQEIAPEYVHEDAESGVLSVRKNALALEAVIGLASRVRVLEAALGRVE